VVGILEEADFLLLSNIQTGSGAQLPAYLMSSGGKSGWGVRLTVHVSSIK